MVTTLATHGTAVTLEGVLLARKDFRALGLTYSLVGLSIGAMLAAVRASGAGLLGVWGVYVWYCAVRALSFAGLGGLLRRPRDAASPPPPAVPLQPRAPAGEAIILFDGVCTLCSKFVQFVLDRDRDGVFRFASLQSEVGRAYVARAGLPQDLSTIVLVDEDGTHTRSTAALRILRGCAHSRRRGAHLVAATFLLWVPRPLRDIGYRLVAASRYSVFGKDDGETCRLMTAKTRARFAVEPPR